MATELHVRNATPGLKLPPRRLNQARHHVLLAHGLAVQAIRAHSRAGTQVGPAENISVAIPAIGTPEHLKAAVERTFAIDSFVPTRDSRTAASATAFCT